MPVKTRSQSRNQWQAKLPAPIHIHKPCQVLTIPEPDLPIYPIFCQRLTIMLDQIEDTEILRSKSLPDTSLNRTLRFEKIVVLLHTHLFPSSVYRFD